MTRKQLREKLRKFAEELENEGVYIVIIASKCNSRTHSHAAIGGNMCFVCAKESLEKLIEKNGLTHVPSETVH